MLYLGFRTRDGVDLELIRRQPHADKILNELQESGLVEVQRDKVISTRTGLLVADGLPVLFSD